MAERSPGEHIPKSIDEYEKYERLKRNVAPFIPLPKGEPEPAVVGELMDFLRPFWGSEHEPEVWELYKRWTRPTEDTCQSVRESARLAGVTEREYIFRAALKHIRDYVRKRPHLAAIPAAQGERSETRPYTPPPLSEQERKAFDIIRALPPGDAIELKQLASKSGIDDKVLTSHVMPCLKRHHGVKNRRNVGYYIAGPATKTT